uniref:hypothetical protein n=1 Tax=Pseudomonas syringae TaxID=317 RepID=UPI001E424EC1|nr:hypothetical protein [Pseudomonas syringae]QOU99758.1 hypothetical protein [Pseudomonas syringae pv. actinidiae]
MKFNPIEFAVDVVRRGHIRLVTKAEEYKANPVQRGIMLMSAGLTLSTLFVTKAAYADGWAGMAKKGEEQGSSIKESLGPILLALGFAGAGFGGMNMWKKTNDENSRITGKQIWGPMVAGAALGGTGFMMTTAGETVGISGSEFGKVPN